MRAELGTTVFLTTHYLEEADSLCDRILIIDRGQIVAAGTAEDLKHQVSGDTINLVVASSDQVSPAMSAAHAVDGATDIAAEGKCINLRVPSSARALPPHPA